ncbi:MAG TPA: choice-of-anchor D domain-containing protein [Candidatus Acidoferrum sp.]|nr:choice-of-anchor D domain-containing protein [Candidatus Acidoferrum sp.]
MRFGLFRKVFLIATAVLIAVAVAAIGGGLRAGVGALSADRVLGQIDFIKNAVNFVDAIGMDAPAGVAIDKAVFTGHVLVADTQNNRVLGWLSVTAFRSGGAADLVIGQADFNSSGCNRNAAAPDATTLCRPIGVAVDGAHRVYVGDAQNNRVLVFADPFAALAKSGQSSGFDAAAVFGQAGSFSTSAANGNGLSADSLSSPQVVALDSNGNLFVADVDNNRALVFFAPIPMTTVKGMPGNFGDATADVAVGQPDLVSGGCNQGGLATLTSLCTAPFFGVGIAADSGGNLYVADTMNDRALEYNGPFGFMQTNNVGADLVFEGNNLAQPSGVAVDSNGNFYVSSAPHHQVYEYTQPVPLGRSDLLNLKIGPGAVNPTAESLDFPMGLAIDAVNNLYVADQANNRVLEFNEAGSPGNKAANGAGGQIDRSHNAPNYVDAVGTNAPRGIAVDATSSPPHRHVYLADSANNRVLGWKDVASFVAAEPADVAFGQPDLFSYNCNNGVAAGDIAGLGADSLCGPARMAVDRKGNLYVADAGNNRVLVYNTPFDAGSGEPGAGDESADFVYGQNGGFTTRNCNPSGASATTLCNPMAAALDGAGNIYIADSGNNRVLEFAKAGEPPVSSDAIANRSYGQGGISDFSGIACADGVGADPSPSNHAMCNPGGVALDAAGNLFVADSGNDRVIEIDAPLLGTQNATRVFGQSGFTASGCNRGATAPDASTMCSPAGLTIDVLGNLWLADVNNDRVLEYEAPFGADTAAKIAIGQGDGGNFTTAGCDQGIAPGDLFGLGADSLCAPAAVAVDSTIDLLVADTSNNRALVYDGILATPTPTVTATASATGTPSPTATATATMTATASATATATATGTPTATPTPNSGGKIKLKPKSIKFGKVAVGSHSASKAINIRNAGTVMLVAAVPTQGAPFMVSGGEFTVSPHGSKAVTIVFAPTVAGTARGVLTITSSDPKHRSVTVKVSGIGR